jgi:hypothetical protein
MNTDKKYYVQRSIDELPKESGEYNFYLKATKKYILGEFEVESEFNSIFKDLGYDHWLEPVTIEQILSEHPEEVEKYRREGFEAAREENPTEIVRYSHNACLIVHTGGQKTKYPTAQDYIDSLKPTQP